MSSLAWLVLIVGLLTLLGSGALLIVTLKYYWGDRGKPPLTGDERRLQKAKEIDLRRKQIEYAEQHPVQARRPDFFDNRKKT